MSGRIESPSSPVRRGIANFPIYYGWVIVVLGALAMLATLPGRTHGLGLITERLLADPDLHLNRLLFGQLNFWATMLGAAFCLPCGWLLDRFGIRRTLTFVTVSLGAVVLGMTHLTGFWPFFIALLLTRGLGQSALSVVSLAMVGKWFSRRLGSAMAVYTILMAVAFITAFVIVEEYRDAPWRTVWSGLGYILLFGMAPLSWCLVRDTPEAHGLNIDGREPTASEPSHKAAGATLLAAVAQPAFWVFALATSTYGLVSSGISLFNEDILIERQFPRETYYTLLKITTGLGLAGNFLGGWLVQRLSLRIVMVASISLLAAALVWMPHVSTFSDLMLYAIGISLGGGMMTVVFFTAFGLVFGRLHLGEIQGIAQMLTVFASALGPISLAWTNTHFGTYTPFFYAAGGLVMALGVWAVFVRIPTAMDAG